MRKVIYPKGTQYVQDYLNIFQNEIGRMQQAWDTLRNTYATELGHIYQDVNDILKADYSVLTRWYILFMQLPLATRKTLNGGLSPIFNYDYWSADIAEYFKNPQNGFNISSCHYCGMAYINVFKVDPNADALYFLNNAADDELSKLTKSAPRIAYVKSQRPYKSKADYDKVASYLRWSVNKWDRTFRPNYKYRHHFDLDHVLPKSEFKLVGLSLYNFVPSCQICNQKLKGIRVLGTGGVPKEKLSPSSPQFDGEKKTGFHILPKASVNAGRLRPTLNPQDYDLKLDAIDPDYEDFIRLFKLDERYQQHKRVALHWLEMKYKYSDARIRMMEKSLNHRSFSFTRIKSDIFQEDLYGEGSMNFSKLREDMLK